MGRHILKKKFVQSPKKREGFLEGVDIFLDRQAAIFLELNFKRKSSKISKNLTLKV
jgi:hypothetical protein